MWWLLLLMPLCSGAPRITPKCEDDLKNVGNTAGYNMASDLLTKAINFSVDPCEDFFEFTCGNWIANHPIPSHKTSYSQFANLSDKVQEKMREIFESKEMFGSKSMNALKAMYRRCMEKDELNRVGARRLLESIRGYGVWPMLDGDDKWRVEDFDLTSLLIHVSEVRGVDVFVSNYISLDSRNVSRRLIEFDQGDLGLGDSTRDYYLDRKKHGKKIAAYRQFLIEKMTQFLQDGDLPRNETKIASDVDEIIDLETKLAKIIVADENRRNYSDMYNLRRLSDMQKLMPLVDWSRYFHSIAPYVVHDYLASNPEILIVEIEYMKRITELLQVTDPRIITNYVYMRYTSSWAGELGEKYEDISQTFHRVMYGKKKKAPRWKDCTSNTMHRMQYAVGAMYVKKAFDQASKNVTLEMIDDLQQEFREMVLNNDWMDTKTKATALDKAKQMLRQIAYPDFILDDDKLDDHYSGFSVQEADSYSQMVGKLSRWSIEYGFKRLIKPVDRTEFNFNAAVVNAYYSSTSNSIKFPAAILQAPFFHHTFPRALNYGGIGAVIGHEITHGFDDQGRQFDSIGNLREWWDADTKKRFEERARCIIKQYGKIEVPGTGLKINGKLTQGENIADNGGIKQAYKAYKNYLKKHGEERRIKGLEQFNNEQMFFLGYATVLLLVRLVSASIMCGYRTGGN
ncbi:peptidase family M13 [Ancylostoma caninum]|uniref:Peptidase family M13 n=1 Tax=Ancylostoma caninum TaxID=29170 RepID=A0A368GGP8_ANCCA|nr:peptidase family M13 [Ancylostoma caninum]